MRGSTSKGKPRLPFFLPFWGHSTLVSMPHKSESGRAPCDLSALRSRKVWSRLSSKCAIAFVLGAGVNDDLIVYFGNPGLGLDRFGFRFPIPSWFWILNASA